MQTPDLRNEAPVSAPGASEVSHPQTTLWENLLWTVPSVSGIGNRFEKQFLLHVLEGLCCMLGSEAAAWATCISRKPGTGFRALFFHDSQIWLCLD